MLPFPGATANVTATCATGFPFASFTITEGGEPTAVPAVADWLVGLFAAIVAAAPALTVVVPVAGAASVHPPLPGAEFPPAPPIPGPLNVAAPLPVVVAAAFVSVAPVGPVAITAVTVVPAWLTALPLASRSCSTGCWSKATPLCAVADGCVLIVSWVGVPAVAVALKGTG